MADSHTNPSCKRSYDEFAQDERLQAIYDKTDVSKGKLRLLKLQGLPAGSLSEDKLRGNLVLREDLEQDGRLPPYAALSYTWGSAPHDKRINIEIIADGDIIPLVITPNLEAVLRELRSQNKPASPLLLWVDAICINQEKNEERNVQVRRMSQIFNEASQVVVWLGEEEEDSGRALSFISRILKLDEVTALAQDLRAVEEWAAFFQLLKRKWFSRRWVIQEIAFAKEAFVHCGKESVPWNEFADAVSLFSSMHKELRQLFKSSKKHGHNADYLGDINELGAVRLIKTYNNLFRESDDKGGKTPLLSLEQLVSQLPAFEATKPQDIIFGVLTLASDVGPGSRLTNYTHTDDETENQAGGEAQSTPSTNNPLPLTQRESKLGSTVVTALRGNVKRKEYSVDYAKSFYEVSKDFLTWTTTRSLSLDIICRPWAPKRTTLELDKLPSWISTLDRLAFRPDGKGVSRRVRPDLLVGMPDQKRNYNASKNKEVRWRFGSGTEDRRLFVEGFLLDTIGSKRLPAQSGHVPYEWFAMGGWTNTKELPPGTFWRTLVADRGPDGQNPPSHYRRACQHAYAMGVEGDDLKTDKGSVEGCPDIVADFLHRVQSVVWQRCLIKTKKHDMLGLVPYEAYEGDLICILYGCSVPVVLRQRKDETSGKYYYILIGECYVYSMMDGSAFKIRNEELKRRQGANEQIDTLDQTFELR